jgi:hypothetical protein
MCPILSLHQKISQLLVQVTIANAFFLVQKACERKSILVDKAVYTSLFLNFKDIHSFLSIYGKSKSYPTFLMTSMVQPKWPDRNETWYHVL